MKQEDTLVNYKEHIESNKDDSPVNSTSAKSTSSLSHYDQKNDDEVNEGSNELNDQNKDCTVINITPEKNSEEDDVEIKSNVDMEIKEVENENIKQEEEKNEDEKINSIYYEKENEEEGDNIENDEEHPNEDINDIGHINLLLNMENEEFIQNESLNEENDDSIQPENMMQISDNTNSNYIHDSPNITTNNENENHPPIDFIQIKETKSRTTHSKG